MRNQIHKIDNVNIYVKPDYRIPLEEATQVALGDLHANAMKLIHFLVVNGIVSIESEDYDTLSSIYLKDTKQHTQADIDQFNAIIEKLEMNSSTLKHILFIGDELADRGKNDWFVLKIIDKLQTSRVIDTTILLSNHGLEYIRACELSLDTYNSSVFPVTSLTNLQQFMRQGFVNRQNIVTMNQNSYYPSLKLVSYIIDGNEISLFTHAPTDIAHIRELALKLKTTFDDSTIDRLKQSLDDINAAFSIHVHKKTVHTLIKPLTREHEIKGFPGDPINFIAWNRSIDILKRHPEHQRYVVHYVHGHDRTAPVKEHIHNLDNSLGKSEQQQIDELHVLSSTGLYPSPSLPISVGDSAAKDPISDVIEGLKKYIEILEQKGSDFDKSGYSSAKSSMDILISNMKEAIDIYEKSSNKDVLVLAGKISSSVDLARLELQKPRSGIPKAMDDFLQASPRGLFQLFKMPTKSSVILDEIDQLVEPLKRPRPTTK